MAAGESCIIETYKTPVSGASYAYFKPKGEAQELTGTWKISFLEGGPELPKTIETKSLGSWTKLEGEAYKNFSGTASYSLDFAKPNASAAGYWLDLGKVAESTFEKAYNDVFKVEECFFENEAIFTQRIKIKNTKV